MLILGQTSNSWYLCCANMVVIVYLCLYFEKIMMPMVIIHELNATDCVRCLLFIFCRPLKVIQTADIKDYHSRMLDLMYTGLIVNAKMNIAVMRTSVLPCPYHWNSLRAVLIRACVTLRHPISHFFKVVPFALFIWVQIMLFPTGPNVL